ncbi:MAG: C1 family peptidase [Bdellovibrionota bacterium]
MRTLFLSLITLIAVAAVAPARASDCKNFYKLLAEELGSVKSDFLAKHNNHYTYEALVTPIKNQCDHGGCWSYGTVSNIESQILKNTGKSVDLSEQYLIMVSLLERT